MMFLLLFPSHSFNFFKRVSEMRMNKWQWLLLYVYMYKCKKRHKKYMYKEKEDKVRRPQNCSGYFFFIAYMNYALRIPKKVRLGWWRMSGFGVIGYGKKEKRQH